MTKQEIVLATLASGKTNFFSPVQVQKLFFLVDKKIGASIGGPFFDFTAYNYGPFDTEVYSTLEILAENKLVSIVRGWVRSYMLTPEGVKKGKEILNGMEPKFREYLATLSDYVTSLGFAELVTAIYNEYPEMKVNSVFRG